MTITEIVEKSKNILIVGHMRADGDCIGAGLALKMALEKCDKKVDFVCDSLLPPFDFMPFFDTINVQTAESYDTVIAEDCGDKLRMGKFKSEFASAKLTVNIDHHISNNGFADFNFVKPTLSSTCEVLYDLLKPLGLIDKDIALCLFVGLSTDTGHFIHNTTTQKVFLMASDLMSYGLDASEIASNIYQQNTPEKTLLISKALASMRLYSENRVGIIVITSEMLESCSCTIVDTEGVIDYLMKVGTVKVGLCITEQRKNSYKVSIRSKGANVAKVAEKFGGGGHVRASGFVINGFLQDVIDNIIKTIQECEIL